MTPEMQAAHDALFGQWKRGKRRVDPAEAEKLAKEKGLGFSKGFTLDAEVYSVFNGTTRLKRGSLEDVVTFIEGYTAPGTQVSS